MNLAHKLQDKSKHENLLTDQGCILLSTQTPFGFQPDDKRLLQNFMYTESLKEKGRKPEIIRTIKKHNLN